MMRVLRPLLIGFVVVGVFYLLGGKDAIRGIRARWRAWQQPAPVESAQPSPVAVPLRATLPREAVRGKMWLSDPPRPVSIVVVLGSILSGAVIAMYVTGRAARGASVRS